MNNFDNIALDFNQQVANGKSPDIKIPLKNGKTLAVHLSIHTDKHYNKDGIEFSFDLSGKLAHFDSYIKFIGYGFYYLPYDEYHDRLDEYIECILANILNGYVYPNNLHENKNHCKIW